jgi:hypothetical protein
MASGSAGGMRAMQAKRLAKGRVELVRYSCHRTDGGVVLVVPVRIVSEPNRPAHWTTKAARCSAQQRAVGACLLGLGKPPPGPWIVVLTRLGPRDLDTDNLAAGCKAARDEIARWLGVDDGDVKRVRWCYGQRRADPVGAFGLHVEVLSAAGQELRECTACAGRGVVL